MLNFSFDDPMRADERLQMLERFLEHFLPPNTAHFSPFWKNRRPTSPVEKARIPRSLQRFYELVERWPELSGRQDFLIAAESLSTIEDGRLVFMDENQGGWVAVTEPDRGDPPVWVSNEMFDEEGTDPYVLESDSLSEFLVTYALITISCAAEVQWSGTSWSPTIHQLAKDSCVLLTDGPYAKTERGDFRFHLYQESVLVMQSTTFDCQVLAAYRPKGIQFIRDFRPLQLPISGDSTDPENIVYQLELAWSPSSPMEIRRGNDESLWMLINDRDDATILFQRRDDHEDDLMSSNPEYDDTDEGFTPFNMGRETYEAPNRSVISKREALRLVDRFLRWQDLDELVPWECE